MSLILNGSGCVVDVTKSFQLTLDPQGRKQSPDLCGPWTVAVLTFANQPNKGPIDSAIQIDQFNETMVDQVFQGRGFNHTNFPGVNPADMINLLNWARDHTNTRIHYQVVPATLDNMRIAVGAGFAVAFSCNEADISAWNKSKQRWEHAYPWQLSAGHLLPVTGIEVGTGNLICPDQLNNSYQGYWPVIYNAQQIAHSLSWMCIVTYPSFLAPIPGPDPTKWPKGFNAQTFNTPQGGAMVPDEPGAFTVPTANYWDRKGVKPVYIIVHGTSDLVTSQQVLQGLANTANTDHEASVHYAIGKDGSLGQGVLEKNAAWGNGILSGPPGVAGDGIHHDAWWSEKWKINPNMITISIEHVKAPGNLENVTDAQKATSFRLIRDICNRWGIPKRAADANGGITGHFSVDPVNRSHCPGPYPWTELWAYLNTTEKEPPTLLMPTMKIPQGWTYKDGVLMAPNNPHPIKTFAHFILSSPNWDGSHDTPEEDEQDMQQLEMTNAGLGPGKQQVFTLSMLGLQQGKDPTKDVIREYIGREFLKLHQEFQILQTFVAHDKDQITLLHQQNDALDTQVTALQAQLQSFQATQEQNVALNARVNDLEQQVLTLSPAHLQDLQNEITNLQQALTQAQSDANLLAQWKQSLEQLLAGKAA